MAASRPRWTVEMVRALPDDGNRYEIVDGELLVTPAPSLRHQDAVLELAVRLREYVREQCIGHLIIAPADVEYDAHTMVEPDVFVVPLVRGRKPRTWQESGMLLLAVEVLSPSTARADRQIKRRVYQRHGVPEYWIVDVDARLIERWRPDDTRPEIVTDTIAWQPDPALAPLTLDLAHYFAEVVDDVGAE